MSTLRVERTFSVEAPPERVWSFLTDPAAVVTCLPGATLTSSSEDGLEHEGTVTVRLGAIKLSYRGTAEFVDVDEERRRIRVRARGREKVGAGAADMSMVSEVRPRGDGSQVDIEADITVTGKIVAFGRGMIGVVSEQLVTDFATNLCRKVSGPEGSGRAAVDSGEKGAEAARASEGRSSAAPAARLESTAAGGVTGADDGPTDGGVPPTRAAPSVLSILLRGIWSRLKRLFEPG